MSHHPFSFVTNWKLFHTGIILSLCARTSTAGSSFTGNFLGTANIHELLYAELQENYGLGWLPRLQGQKIMWDVIAVSSNDPNLTGYANSSPSQAKSMWTALNKSGRALECVSHCLPKTMWPKKDTPHWSLLSGRESPSKGNRLITQKFNRLYTFCFSAITSENIYHENA